MEDWTESFSSPFKSKASGPTGGLISQAGHRKCPVLPNTVPMQPHPTQDRNSPALAAAGLPAGTQHTPLNTAPAPLLRLHRGKTKGAKAGNPGAPAGASVISVKGSSEEPWLPARGAVALRAKGDIRGLCWEPVRPSFDRGKASSPRPWASSQPRLMPIPGQT